MQMRAIVVTAPGGPEVLRLGRTARPEPGPGQVRVRVRAAGVNRADVLQRRGLYPAPAGWAADVPGLEFAGEIDATGLGVARWSVGDRAMGLVGSGGYAEFVVVHEREAMRVPEGMSWEEAAAIPEVFVTAHDALFTRARLGLGETVLVHAIGSGVGTAALQLAKAAGAQVLGTSRSGWKLERATELGLDAGIDPAAGGFVDAVRGATGGRGADVVLELVGGPYLADDLRCLAPQGRIVLVGLTGGRTAELDLGVLLGARATVIGTTLRARPLEEKIDAARRFERHAGPLFAAGRLHPVVDRVLPFAEAAEAHRAMEADENFGKIVMIWD